MRTEARLVLACALRRPADLEAGNPGFVGGDSSGGAVEDWQLFVCATPDPRVLLRSSSAPRGPGVHGRRSWRCAG